MLIRTNLGPLERDVMSMMWRLKTASTRDIHRRFMKEGRDLAYTTIMTVMRRLEQKGFLTHVVEGRTFIYRPLISEKATRCNIVTSIIDQLFGGAAGQLVNELADEKKLKRSDIEALRDIVDSYDWDAESD